MKEMARQEKMKECDYCLKKKQEKEKYDEEIEKEKIMECIKALERDKIIKGEHYGKADELKLRQMQKLQMQERKDMDKELKAIDNMWHELLLEEIKMKEQKEEYDAQMLKQEMQKRRQAYDAQIASANKQRREGLEKEREIENRRLKQIKERMEKEYYDALKRKKQQMLENKKNLLQGHEMKMNRLRQERELERNIDLENIQAANDELRREKKNKLDKIRHLQVEKQIFIDNFQIEKQVSDRFNKETDTVASHWRQEQDEKVFTQLKKLKEEKSTRKEEALREYKNYVNARNMEMDKKRQMRKESMESVKKVALQELQKNMDSANDELRKQIEYRKNLSQQIYQKHRVLDFEKNQLDQRQMPFTSKAITFKDAIANKLNNLSQRGPPVHPFLKLVSSQTKHGSNIYLPSLDKTL